MDEQTLDEQIPAALDGERIDRVIAMLSGRTRAEVTEMIDGGRVRLGGQAVTSKSRRVAEGQRIEVELPPARIPEVVEPDPTVPFEVVHEDDDVLVVDKPPGVVVHPGSGSTGGTLVHGLLARFPEIAGVGQPDRPGIVHRLDRGTSGLLAVARSAVAYEGLVDQLAGRSVDRRYTALVIGSVEGPGGLVDGPIGRSERDPTRMAVTASGREARTRYDVVARFSEPMPLTELDCKLETGRTHQIRVHLLAIGHPVAGDTQYAGDRPALDLGRPFLHARELGFRHPVTGEEIRCVSPLPADLLAFRDRLR